MTISNRALLWAQFHAAALTGLLAAESEDFRFPHKADAVSTAAKIADFSLGEYDRRARDLYDRHNGESAK